MLYRITYISLSIVRSCCVSYDEVMTHKYSVCGSCTIGYKHRICSRVCPLYFPVSVLAVSAGFLLTATVWVPIWVSVLWIIACLLSCLTFLSAFLQNFSIIFYNGTPHQRSRALQDPILQAMGVWNRMSLRTQVSIRAWTSRIEISSKVWWYSFQTSDPTFISTYTSTFYDVFAWLHIESSGAFSSPRSDIIIRLTFFWRDASSYQVIKHRYVRSHKDDLYVACVDQMWAVIESKLWKSLYFDLAFSC